MAWIAAGMSGDMIAILDTTTILKGLHVEARGPRGGVGSTKHQEVDFYK